MFRVSSFVILKHSIISFYIQYLTWLLGVFGLLNMHKQQKTSTWILMGYIDTSIAIGHEGIRMFPYTLED